MLKARYLVLASLAFFMLVSTALAQWPQPQNKLTYAVTTDYHGDLVPTGSLVTVTAGTINTAEVTNVEFVWHNPDTTVHLTEIVSVTIIVAPTAPPAPLDPGITLWASAHSGVQYAYAQSAHAPDVPGDWGVQAIFRGPTGREVNSYTEVIQIRATSFNVIPEVPIIGTIGAAASMLLGLGLFTKGRRKVF